jgi:hypothetical protein
VPIKIRDAGPRNHPAMIHHTDYDRLALFGSAAGTRSSGTALRLLNREGAIDRLILVSVPATARSNASAFAVLRFTESTILFVDKARLQFSLNRLLLIPEIISMKDNLVSGTVVAEPPLAATGVLANGGW